MAKKKENTKKSNTGKYILIGLGVVAVGGIAYFFYNKSQLPNSSILTDDLISSTNSDTDAAPTETAPRASSGGSSAGFPLKRGSRGDTVKKIQNLLIQKYGSSILPKYGADGIWGAEMEAALTAKGFPNNISEELLNQWTAAGVINLSGFGHVLCDQIRSIVPVRVWNAKGKAVNVPRGTILGEYIDGKNGITRFRTVDGNILFTNTQCICYV